MGDRANIFVINDTENVCLYTHSSGSKLPNTLKDALKRGKNRWSDFQYLTRIIFSEMIKDNVMGEEGFGISQQVWDGEDNIIYVDVNKQQITHKDRVFTFKEYIKK